MSIVPSVALPSRYLQVMGMQAEGKPVLCPAGTTAPTGEDSPQPFDDQGEVRAEERIVNPIGCGCHVWACKIMRKKSRTVVVHGRTSSGK